MSKVTADVSMSLDGFVTEPNPGGEHPLGDDPGRMHDWMFSGKTAADAEIVDELYATTGSVLIGKRMFDVGVEPWGDPPPFGMPVFVVTHESREPLPRQGGTTYHFVTGGLEAALADARAVSDEKDVGIWGGANIVTQYLQAGLLDELQLPDLTGSLDQASPRHANMCSCRTSRRSCTQTSTRSTRRSSSETTPASAAAPSSSGRAWCWLPATRRRRSVSRTPMGGAQARRLCPHAVVVPPRMDAYSEASKALFEVFNDTTPFVEGLSIDEAFLDVGGLRRISGTPTEIAVRLRREVLERVGLPITVGVARTKFLAKVASGVAKPDGLLVVPTDGELEFLHPLPVERLWGVGPVTAASSALTSITTVGQVAQLGETALVRMLGRPAGRHLHALAHNRDPRRGPGRSPSPLDGHTARARPRTAITRTRSTPTSSRWSTDSRAGCERPTESAARSSFGCGSTTSRARRGRTRSRRRPRTPRRSSHGRRGLLAAAMPMIRDHGITLIGLTLSNLDDDSAVQLALPLDRSLAAGIDTTLDEVRDRFGSSSITRAVLLGRRQGPSVPLLPD